MVAAGGEPDLVLANEEPVRWGLEELTALDLLPTLDPREHLVLDAFTLPGRREEIVAGRVGGSSDRIRPAVNEH